MDTTNSQSPAGLTTLLEGARQELIRETTQGSAGRAAVECYADRIDTLLQRLFFEAPQATQPVAILALGGYGRRHLTLFSDVDILVLFEGPLNTGDERFLRGFLHPLWDLQLVVGHQVRELGDFARLETDNPEFLARPARRQARRRRPGDLLAFHDRVPPAGHARVRFSRPLQALIDERHAKFNGTLYQLEPDVKEAPGALRDLLARGPSRGSPIPRCSAAARPIPARLDEAEDFLLRVRSIAAPRSESATRTCSATSCRRRRRRLLGYAGAQPQQRVERLMGDYFRHARIVAARSTGRVKTAPAPVGVNLVRSRDGIRFVDAQRAAREPHTWLHAFQAAIDHETGGRRRSAGAASSSTSTATRAEDFFPTARDRDALLSFLKPRPGLYARLSEMHDCGLLGRMFPEFQAISCRVVRDFYHKYTVDEHTLLTIRNLERLDRRRRRRAASGSRGCSPSSSRAGAAGARRCSITTSASGATRITRRERADGAADVRPARPRRRNRAAMVEFLIRHHLKMSLVAFRRDTEDPEIVRQFAALVGIEERLKMLCLMTLADVEAVSPETLTPWKEELLWRLYVDTYNHLTLRYGDELIDRDQSDCAELLAGRPPDLSGGRDPPLPRRAAAPLPAAVRPRTRSIGTCGCRATSSRTTSTRRSSRKATALGADRRHARQAVPVLEHLRRAVVVRHGHPARATR